MKIYKRKTRSRVLRDGPTAEEDENRLVEKISTKVVSQLLKYFRTHGSEIIEFFPIEEIIRKNITGQIVVQHIQVPVQSALDQVSVQEEKKEFIPAIDIDETIIDVGVSTAGMEKGGNQPIGDSSTESDALTTRDKLRKLKDTKKDE